MCVHLYTSAHLCVTISFILNPYLMETKFANVKKMLQLLVASSLHTFASVSTIYLLQYSQRLL